MKPIVSLGLVLLLIAEVGCKKAAPPAPGPLPVNVVTVVEKEVNEWDEFTGRLEAVESVEIRPRVSGYITEIHFEAGAIIKKGDLLYVIDPRPYQADFDRAAAEFERMQAQLKLAQIELDRAKELRTKNTISASEFDQKAATYQGASAAAASVGPSAFRPIWKYGSRSWSLIEVGDQPIRSSAASAAPARVNPRSASPCRMARPAAISSAW